MVPELRWVYLVQYGGRAGVTTLVQNCEDINMKKNGGGDKLVAFRENGGCKSCAHDSYNTPHYGLTELQISLLLGLMPHFM